MTGEGGEEETNHHSSPSNLGNTASTTATHNAPPPPRRGDKEVDKEDGKPPPSRSSGGGGEGHESDPRNRPTARRPPFTAPLLVSQGLSALETAIALERQGDLPTAAREYGRGVTRLVEAAEAERDQENRNALRERASEYLTRLEEIQRQQRKE